MVEVPGSGSQWAPGGSWGNLPQSYYYTQTYLWPSGAEMKHLALTGLIGVAVGNPVVSLGIGLIHWNYHILKPLFTSSGGGGPGEVLTSAAPPSITYRGGPTWPQGLGRPIISAHGGGRSGAKPRKRCPPGFHWNGRRCVSN